MPSPQTAFLADPDEPLSDILARIEHEMIDAAQMIETLEPHLCQAASGPEAEADRITALQGIDLAVQKIRGLAEFLAAVRAMVPDACLIDTATALNVVKLADMQRRLASGAPAQAAPAAKAAGDIELF